MLNPRFRLALLAGVVVSLAGCSFISGMFPDKQKQYRYSSELADLEIPPDLSGGKLDDKVGRDSRDEIPLDTTQTKKRKPSKHNSAGMTLAESGDDNTALIEVSEPYVEAWNDVSRALGRLKVEITDQNRSDGVFYVFYGGEAPKKQDEKPGFWDSVKSALNIEKDKAKEYRIKLVDKDDVTIVKVLDTAGKGISEGPGLELLKRLHKKLITLDIPEPTGEAARKAEEAEKVENEKSGSRK
jgi:uncharacterized lipoprotein